MAQYRIEFGQRIIAKEDAEAAKKHREESKRGRHQPVDDDSQYKKEEKIVYVSGFDRHLAFVDLENYLKKYGEIVHVESKIDNVRLAFFNNVQKGRNKGFVFVEYKDAESAANAVEDSGRANILGHRLTINYKVTKVKVLVDRDCWFCIDNPNVSMQS